MGGKRRREQRRQRRDGAVHQAGKAGLHILQHEHAPRRLVFGGARLRGQLLAEIVGEFFVLVLGGGKPRQEIAHRVVARGLGGAAIEARGLILHLFGELARGVQAERAVEPDWPAFDEAFDVLPADQRQKVAEFLAVKIEQHVAMPDLFLRHFIVHIRSVRVGPAEPVGEGAVDAVVFVFVRYGERQSFLLVEVGKAFHGLPLGGAICMVAVGNMSYLERF